MSPRYAVEVSAEGRVEDALCDVVEALARQAMAVVVDGKAELSVVLCDDDVMAPLNQEWRGKAGPTDVLSFPLDDGDDGDGGGFVLPPGMPRQLGDLVISVDTARRQADELGHDLHTELRVLVVHGLLHLLGYDHEQGEAEAAQMRSEEARVLATLGGGQGLIDRVGP